jgi:inorganic pyrophosphatase/exopolyphosphatase
LEYNFISTFTIAKTETSSPSRGGGGGGRKRQQKRFLVALSLFVLVFAIAVSFFLVETVPLVPVAKEKEDKVREKKMGVGAEKLLSEEGLKKRSFHAYSERDETPLEEAVETEWSAAHELLFRLPKKGDASSDSFIPEELKGALFCGHVVTDLDSIAGAIGAAVLHGGVAARASEINSETEFALEYWNCSLPEKIEDLIEEESKVCLVDFQQQSQLNPAIPMKNIVGIIDHHALQSNTIVTEKPIFVDIRPWGCMSAIIAHSFLMYKRYLPRKIGGMLLSAILSDTLNLKSPTTTEWDRRIVAMLVQYIGVKDINELAAKQFRAKSHSLSVMSAYQLVSGDMKQFKFHSGEAGDEEIKIAYSVIETTDAEAATSRLIELLPEMRKVKEELKVHAMLLAIVDIVNLTSALVLCGRTEQSLAKAAYDGALVDGNTHLMELKGLVSRKQDFIPPLTKAVKGGWIVPKFDGMARSESKIDVAEGEVEVVYSENPQGELRRVAHKEEEEEDNNEA